MRVGTSVGFCPFVSGVRVVLSCKNISELVSLFSVLVGWLGADRDDLDWLWVLAVMQNRRTVWLHLENEVSIFDE